MKHETREYEGHIIELRKLDDRPELVIDSAKVPYGQLPDGKYFLQEYAFDWTDNLMELAQRFIDHRNKADRIRSEQARKGREAT